MTFVPHFEQFNQIDLDKILNLDENRKPNNLGLYRMNCLVIGKTGTGKTTTLLKALLTNAIDNFKLVIFIIPRESMNSGFYKKLEESVRAKRINMNIAFVIIGEDDLPTISRINELSKQYKGPIAIVLDDFINAFNKKAGDWLMFKRYITQLSRIKYGASLFALTQNWQQFETQYRKNFNCFILFVNSLREQNFREIMNSYYDHGNYSKEQISELYNIFKQDLHTPLWLINCPEKDKSMIYDGLYLTEKDIFTNSDSDSDFYFSESE